METKNPQVIKNYFSFHFKVLLCFGVPIEKLEVKFKPLYIFYAAIVNVFVSTLYPILEFLAIIFYFDADSFSFIICYFISHFLAFFKILLIFIFRNSISKFCKTIETGRFLPNVQRGGDVEMKYVRDAITTSNKQSYFFHLFVILIVGQRGLYSLVKGGKYVDVYDDNTDLNATKYIPTKPFICYLPFESNTSPLHELVSIYQVLCCAISGFIIGAADAVIYGFMCHIKAQFLILINSLETFVDRTERVMLEEGIEINLDKFKSPKRLSNGIELLEKLPEQAQKYANNVITDCVQHHQEILLLAEGCETTFSLLLLLQFAGSSLMICMQLYQLSIYEIPSFPFFTMLCYLVLMSVQILIFCWHGNEVRVFSDKISDIAFHSNWQITNISTQKSILLMITRSIRPVKLTAGKFIFLSLESFMSLMKGSASYYMFLKEMNKEG